MQEQKIRTAPGNGDILRVKVDKYEVVQTGLGNVVALRDGQPWRDCTGDNLVLALAYRVDALEEKLAGECQAAAPAGLHGIQHEGNAGLVWSGTGWQFGEKGEGMFWAPLPPPPHAEIAWEREKEKLGDCPSGMLDLLHRAFMDGWKEGGGL